MTLEEANEELLKIVDEYNDTIYLKAETRRHGGKIVAHIEGHIDPKDLVRIANIASCIDA